VLGVFGGVVHMNVFGVDAPINQANDERFTNFSATDYCYGTHKFHHAKNSPGTQHYMMITGKITHISCTPQNLWNDSSSPGSVDKRKILIIEI